MLLSSVVFLNTVKDERSDDEEEEEPVKQVGEADKAQ